MSTTAADPTRVGLEALDKRVRQDLEYLEYNTRGPWLPLLDGFKSAPVDAAVLDVAIIGAGMAGTCAAAALAQLGIRSVLFDSAPEGLEGPWGTTARMLTLRSPKELAGPALGVPSLTFRAWFEAQHGAAAWAALDKIPTLQWLEYLRWYRRVLGLEVRSEMRLESLELPPGPARTRDAPVTLHFSRRCVVEGDTAAAAAGASDKDERITVRARRVVLATGRAGLGGPHVPAAMVAGLPRHCWAHTAHVMDYAALRGKTVGIVGGGSSAMDSAGTALEHGAAGVELLIRRTDMIRINKSKADTRGQVVGTAELPDAWRFRIAAYKAAQVPPPRGSVLRVSAFANAHFFLGCPVHGLAYRSEEGRVVATTPRGERAYDFIILATGYRHVDWRQRPEFASIAPLVCQWKDVVTAAELEAIGGGSDDMDRELLEWPYVGRHYELLDRAAVAEARAAGRDPTVAPRDSPLSLVYCFSHVSTVSHGNTSGDIPAISVGARRLAQGIATAFFTENVREEFDYVLAYDDPELLGDEWTDASAAL